MKFLQKKSIRILLIVLASLLLIAGASFLYITETNAYYLELDLPDKPITLEYGVDEFPEVTASLKGTIIRKKGIPVTLDVLSETDTNTLGTHSVTFVAKYKHLILEETREFMVVDTQAPTITLVADPDLYVSPVGKYKEEGFTATDNYDGDITEKVLREEKDDKILYTVTDSAGNTTTVERILVYKDTVAPTITLTGETEMPVTFGGTFTDPGFTAKDDVDGDITANVTVDGTVDVKTLGTYTLTYTVKDSSGNTATATRTVIVKDMTPPSISLHGAQRQYIFIGSGYSDPGAVASDNMDGDITSRIKVTGGVDTNVPGTHTITYSVTDSSGNTTTVSRSILVYQQQAVQNTIAPGNKVVYLTFDDGPSAHTARLLDILDKYNVKATFFVTNQFPNQQHMIGETYRRGHTIALHTYSHNYASLYSSEAAYYQDLEAIKNICVAQTGVVPTLVRFPGGTSNTVSRKYCAGIMSVLSESLSYHGYLYTDWNVDSQDAVSAFSASAVAANVISGIQRKNVSIVLQHDIKGYSVNAVEEILFWGINNGYTFLPMDNTSPLIHFNPRN